MSLSAHFHYNAYGTSGIRLKERNAAGESVTQTHRVRLLIDAIAEKQ